MSNAIRARTRASPEAVLQVEHGPATAVPVEGPLLEAFQEVRGIQARREEIVERKRALRKIQKQLEEELNPDWRAAHQERKWRRDLGGVEFRNETALVDQFALLDHYVTDEGEVVHEDVDVRAETNKDDRLWSFVLRGEAILVRRFIAPQERWVRGVLQKQRRFIEGHRAWQNQLRQDNPVVGWPVLVLTAVPLILLRGLLKLEGLLFLNVIKGQQALADSAVNLPILAKSSYEVAKGELRTGEGRRKMRLAILNERLWTPERRQTLLFFLAIIGGVVYLLSEITLQFFDPVALQYKRQMDLVFFYAIATRLFLPTPFEPILLAAVDNLGWVLVVLAAAAGATAGSYLLFLIGGKANEGLHKLTAKRPRLKKSLEWMEYQGRKYAYAILGLLLCIPLMPDTLAILGTLLRLRLGPFLMTIFVSTVVRSLATLLIAGKL